LAQDQKLVAASIKPARWSPEIIPSEWKMGPPAGASMMTKTVVDAFHASRSFSVKAPVFVFLTLGSIFKMEHT